MDLSVVIPCFNVAETIGAQFDSLLRQQWDGEWEIVVVDNRSTDDTARIAKEYIAVDPRIRLVTAPDKPGISYARNVGILSARSENIALCDGDDIVEAGWVAAMGEALKNHEVVTGMNKLSAINSKWLLRSRGGERAELHHYEGMFAKIAGNNAGFHRALWDAIGRFNEDLSFNYAEDTEFSLRLWRHGATIKFVPKAVVHYRYRTELAALWRQGRTYGLARVRVAHRLRELGLKTPAPLAGWRSWLWLVWHLPDLFSAEGRAAWVWVAGNRAGQLLGSLRWRIVQL